MSEGPLDSDNGGGMLQHAAKREHAVAASLLVNLVLAVVLLTNLHMHPLGFGFTLAAAVLAVAGLAFYLWRK
jgi:hypothetical protein